MLDSKYAIDLDSVDWENEAEVAKSFSKWVEDCSSPSTTTAINEEALAQIKCYESKYQMSSHRVLRLAKKEEFIDNLEISHWLMLIDSYPECLDESNLDIPHSA